MTLRVDRRGFTRAGLASAAALVLPRTDPRAAASPGLRLGLVTYNVARDWDLDTLLRICRDVGIEGFGAPFFPTSRFDCSVASIHTASCANHILSIAPGPLRSTRM